jgi:hypothetical protein
MYVLALNANREMIMTALTPSNLHAMRDDAWTELEAKYPNEPAIALIRGIDQYLAGAVMPIVSKKEVSAKKNAVVSKRKDNISEIIADSSLKFFSKTGNQPIEASDIETPLRNMGIPLPDNRHAARVMIATAFRRRPDLFKKIPGEKARDPFKWVAA